MINKSRKSLSLPVISISLLLILSMVSCVYHPYKSLLYIKKGLSKSTTVEIVNRDLSFDTWNKNHELMDLSKDISTGDSIHVLIKEKDSGAGAPFFLFAFQNDKLIYWGYVEEFTKSSNTLYNAIGEAAIRRIFEISP